MKKIILISFLSFFISVNKIYAQVNFNWAKQMVGNTTTAISTGYDITLDASGNVYTIGSFSGTVDFDPGPGTFTLIGSGTYVSKLDAAGNFLWAKNVANGNSMPRSINIDALGNIFTFGNFTGTVDFDPGLSVFNLICTPATGNSSNVFITKLDAFGNFVWAKQIIGSVINYNHGFDMTLDFNGNIIFTGSFNGVLDFDPGPATYTVASASSTITVFPNMYVCKLDPSGNFIWVDVCVAYNTNDYGYSIKVDQLNNIYYTGQIGGSGTDVDPGPSTYTLSGAFVIKLDVFGNFIWGKSFVGFASGRGIDLDPLGNVYSAGIFNSTVDFDPGPGIYNLTNVPNGSDIYVSKLSNTGNFIWAQQMGGTIMDIPYSIAVDLSGNAYVSGSGGIDIIIGKIDVVGNFTWAKQFGGGISDVGYGIVVDVIENIYVTGRFNGNVDFDPSPGTYTLATSTNTINSDAFVLKWSKCTPTVSPPTNATNAANQNICVGNTATLSTNGPALISWFAYPNSPAAIGTSSIYITPTLSVGTYTYYAESNVCSIGRASITVTVNPSPTLTANGGTICSGQSFTINPSGASTYTFSSGSNIVTPTVLTSYSVTGTSTAGCISATPAIVSVSVNPTPTITVNNGAICVGQSFTLIPSGANTYTFSSGNSTVSPTTSTTYSISGTNLSGCVTTTPAISNVTVNALPLIIATTNNSLICSGQSATLTSSGANTFTWSNSVTGNNSVVSPTVNTTYTVMGTDVNGCNNSATVTQSVSVCTGFVKSSGVETNLITIYPNPSTGIFNINCNIDSDILVLEVYNALGQKILDQKILSENTSVDLSKYAKGIYYLKVNAADKQEVFKLIKE
jgi:hypothetical protein